MRSLEAIASKTYHKYNLRLWMKNPIGVHGKNPQSLYIPLSCIKSSKNLQKLSSMSQKHIICPYVILLIYA